jgi:hypothetical protein
MEEIFTITATVNRLKDKVIELSFKIDFLSKCTDQQYYSKYVAAVIACKILHVNPLIFAKMRADGLIPYIKSRKKSFRPSRLSWT